MSHAVAMLRIQVVMMLACQVLAFQAVRDAVLCPPRARTWTLSARTWTPAASLSPLGSSPFGSPPSENHAQWVAELDATSEVDPGLILAPALGLFVHEAAIRLLPPGISIGRISVMVLTTVLLRRQFSASASSNSSLLDPGPLPDQWIEYMDPESGRPYYVSPEGEATWQRPVAMPPPSPSPSPPSPLTDQADSEIDPDPLPDGWAKLLDPAGRPYYVSPDGQTTWQKPSTLAPVGASPPPTATSALPSPPPSPTPTQAAPPPPTSSPPPPPPGPATIQGRYRRLMSGSGVQPSPQPPALLPRSGAEAKAAKVADPNNSWRARSSPTFTTADKDTYTYRPPSAQPTRRDIVAGSTARPGSPVKSVNVGLADVARMAREQGGSSVNLRATSDGINRGSDQKR